MIELALFLLGCWLAFELLMHACEWVEKYFTWPGFACVVAALGLGAWALA
jgi:hypothetical protein